MSKSRGGTQGSPTRIMSNDDSLVWIRRASLTAVVVQNTALALCMRLSRIPEPIVEGKAPTDLYIVSTAVLCGELLKLIVSFGLALQEEHFEKVTRDLFSKNALVMLIPATLYTLQNNLQYVAVSNLDISVCQVLYQMKLVTTALFSVGLLGRSLSYWQWSGIVTCAFGVALVQLSTESKGQGQSKQGEQAWIGFAAVSTACVTSGLAAVYTEKVFKSGETSMWVRNMHLAAWSLLAGASGIIGKDWDTVSTKGFFVGYNPMVCLVIVLQALGGMAVAMVAKYSDNIAKGFATAVSIIFTCLFSVMFFDSDPNRVFLLGTIMVLASLFFYTKGSNSSGVAAERKGYIELSSRSLQKPGV